jgi:hypothetical protein
VSARDLTFCFHLKAIHVQNAGQDVELEWFAPSCGSVKAAKLLLRLDVEDGEKYMLGDTYYIHMRGMP